MIDTHAHLDFPQFDKDREKVIQEAKSCGVERILNVGVDAESSQKSVDLAQKYPQIYATVGFHPHDAKKFNQSSLEELRKLAQHQKVVALGEMGLDFYRNLSPAEIQKRIFISQLELAQELDMPVVVHIRNAYPQSLEILERGKVKRGVLHCFEGNIDEAKRGLDLGFYVSFNGRITYHNPSLIDLVKQIPLDRILVETDSPYLPPHPHKRQRNQPAWVELVIREIAQIKGKLVFEEVERITTSNACNLFGLKQDEK
jgi:TatD DNase family protein